MLWRMVGMIGSWKMTFQEGRWVGGENGERLKGLWHWVQMW